MCDSPTLYEKEQETTNFISQIPTTWDETVEIEGAVSDYIVLAKRKGENWYIGAMTDWSSRNFDINLSFLDDKNMKSESLRIGLISTGIQWIISL